MILAIAFWPPLIYVLTFLSVLVTEDRKLLTTNFSQPQLYLSQKLTFCDHIHTKQQNDSIMKDD